MRTSIGAWEGLTPEEIDAQFKGAYQQWRTHPSSVMIPGAEPTAQFRLRVRRALERVLRGLGAGDCVVVSHGGVIAAVLADIVGADSDALLQRVRLDNGGITAVEFGNGVPHVLWIDSTAHLTEVSSPT